MASSSSTRMLSFFFVIICFCQIEMFSLCSCNRNETLVLPLSHRLSKTMTTTVHLLKSSANRSAGRFYYHKHSHHRQHRHQQISLSLQPGSDYTISVNIGHHPSQILTLYMDTGSDLVWFPCAPFECILCEGKLSFSDGNRYLPSSSSAVPCYSPACSAVHSSLPSSDLCAISGCPLDIIETSTCSFFDCPPLYYAYGDGSLIARLFQDRLSISTSKNNFSDFYISNFTFGCAHTTLAEPVGVAGFGGGVLSFPTQLSAVFPPLGDRFSYCLVSHSFSSRRLLHPSPLILGHTSTDQSSEFIYTPMLENPKHPYFYSVGLEAISIGKTRVPAPKILKTVKIDGSGGLVVDSGTTFTMLPAKMHRKIVSVFDNRINSIRAYLEEDQTGLSPCYYLDSVIPPKLVLHFIGNATVSLPRNNYFFISNGKVQKNRKFGCFMIMSSVDEPNSGGPAAILGNFQQQDFEVEYDLRNKRVGFARRHCASLWDSLNLN